MQFIIYSSSYIFSQRNKLSISWVIIEATAGMNTYSSQRPAISKGMAFSAHLRMTRILESGKSFLMDSGILGFGIQNTTQGIRTIWSLANDWNLELSSTDKNQESGMRNPKRGIQNPRSTVLDNLTWSEPCFLFENTGSM